MSLRSVLLGSSSPAALLALTCLLAGCPRSQPPPYWLDGGPRVDAAVPGRIDSDEDGLCDPQEEMRGLRIDHPDTDGDGYSDLTEVSLGFDAFQPASPDRETIVLLPETPTSEARVTFNLAVSGMGETYAGSFQAVDQIFPDGIDASDFYAGSGPVGAEPMVNVFAIDEARQSFVGVTGRTQLIFDVRFAFATSEPLGCMRAYPFQYVVKREDGRIVTARRFTLVVAPNGASPGAGTWCGASPCW
ncbi:MAG: hypothetical protein M3Y87_05495 [Myxococcota bacterium]|nr:hypothetical protein [Myxococcota bacterium]